MYYIVKYRVLLGTGKWARYIDRDIKSQAFFTVKALECLPNRLTPLYSEIHYKKENYLKVRTELLIYPSPPHSKGLSMSVRQYTSVLNTPHTHVPIFRTSARTEFRYITWLPLIL